MANISYANISYVRGDATNPPPGGNRFIVHICNDAGGWGAGFVLSVSRRWTLPEAAYRSYARSCLTRDESMELGALQLVKVEEDLWVVNLIGQVRPKIDDNIPPIRYLAIWKGLDRIRKKAQQHGASVHMPRIGCGLAGGDWDSIEPMIRKQLSAFGIQVTVYDP